MNRALRTWRSRGMSRAGLITMEPFGYLNCLLLHLDWAFLSARANDCGGLLRLDWNPQPPKPFRCLHPIARAHEQHRLLLVPQLADGDDSTKDRSPNIRRKVNGTLRLARNGYKVKVRLP